MCNNTNINYVSFMLSLIRLVANLNSGIDQNGIKNLNLIKLSVNDNSKIYDVYE